MTDEEQLDALAKRLGVNLTQLDIKKRQQEITYVPRSFLVTIISAFAAVLVAGAAIVAASVSVTAALIGHGH